MSWEQVLAAVGLTALFVLLTRRALGWRPSASGSGTEPTACEGGKSPQDRQPREADPASRR